MPNSKLGRILVIRKLLVISILLAGTTMAGVGFAQPNHRQAGDRPRVNLRNVDTDSDGLISQLEFTKPRTEHLDRKFERRDRDNDALLSREELDGRRRHRGAPMEVETLNACVAAKGGETTQTSEQTDRFAAADTDDDDFLSYQEFSMLLEQRAVTLFRRIDANSDDQLTTDELSARKEDRGIQRGIVRGCIKAQRNPDA